MMGSSKRSRLLWGVLLFVTIIIFAPNLMAQNTVTVYVGNVDGSLFHVPNQGIVDLPVWMAGPRVGGGRIGLNTCDEIISERLGGGNFYLDGEHGFTTPESLSGWTRQILTFMPGEWRESVFRLADFTVQVDVDSSRIGEIVDALQIIPADFTDTTGENFFCVYTHVSQLAIDGVTRTEEQISEPIIFAHRPAYPDPFNASTTISFESATGGEVRLSIFDINGRLVRAFGARKVSPGKNSIIWERTNNNNGSLSSGIYIYRIECGDNVAAARVTLLK